MKTGRQFKGIDGSLIVNAIVNDKWKSDFQKIDQENDDSIDAMVLIRKQGEVTGEVIYMQIKAGDGYQSNSASRHDHIGINVSKKYIESHRPRWNTLPGAVILVYVSDEKITYWTDLKSESSYSRENRNIILVPKIQKFGEHSKGAFKKMGNYIKQSNVSSIVEIKNSDLAYLRIDESIIGSGRKYYNEWSKSDAKKRTNPGLGEVNVNRVGWRHMTDAKKGYARIIQGMQLLCVAKKIILGIDKAYQITKPVESDKSEGEYTLSDFISLRAEVIFPHRQKTIVQVILIRKRLISTKDGKIDQRVWLYSVYEPLRGLKLPG
ncbi:DUF4365 domain-containing protein [Dyadobacter fanqingshengii]|uniref:DUF4365 domain-containing protein n=1 Tax=Dyadobacter fanqingshengii TaxID=2906443 RepID=A0A9X1T7G8_9BACT|nr:DUF4365 domain-containing protein [Dyadobacter fanqingshengii]MCF0038691.1 DUF4365 domain-containing protein [Dyadobacter fanqingshengii]USJ34476.1 DUF4365 domain-containing protein [Dyadobacter fanqingshengii]